MLVNSSLKNIFLPIYISKFLLVGGRGGEREPGEGPLLLYETLIQCSTCFPSPLLSLYGSLKLVHVILHVLLGWVAIDLYHVFIMFIYVRVLCVVKSACQ